MPDLDEAYKQAVKKGDTETAQKLVDAAAREKGYDIKAYHMTGADFTVFGRNNRFHHLLSSA